MNKPDLRIELLGRDLPSPDAAWRFFEQFGERNPSHSSRLQKNDGLLSDVLTLASYSPLLATTLIQNPEYVGWLSRKRRDSTVRGKEELLESLARFALTNSQLEPNVLFARFRRRELLRIFLRDVRRLGTIAEITEEISNLADAILENALRIARQEMDNRYGPPFEMDESGRQRPSDISIVSLGKLGSKELNYSSDIDLLFIYSADGTTNGSGSRGVVTNREYFVKLAEFVTNLLGRQGGEGAAYRVDMRLRPHGRVGALALSLKETTKYYLNEARNWEQQVLIRSRASAGSDAIFKNFFHSVEETVFRPGRDVDEALRGVFQSKEKIDQERRAGAAFDVKLGRGGIREIEFIAQALQLAHGGTDRWLRVPHTLMSIARLADRGYLTEDEFSRLSNAYDFLRRLEHILQMENGLQTHSLPGDDEKRGLIARRMRFASVEEFAAAVTAHTGNVHRTFLRVFGDDAGTITHGDDQSVASGESEFRVADSSLATAAENLELRVAASLNKLADAPSLNREQTSVLRFVSQVSPKFTEMIASMPRLAGKLRVPGAAVKNRDYRSEFRSGIEAQDGHAAVLSSLRVAWSGHLFEIAVSDIHEVISVSEARGLQTKLAEASIGTAMRAAVREIEAKHKLKLVAPSVLALGKLGSGTLDYDSDLDLIIVYDETAAADSLEISAPELYSRVVEQFITMLSDMTRDGNLYRVDLRLRPHGKNGPNVVSKTAFAEYIEQTASVWELLAYVQMREIEDGMRAGDGEIESAIRRAIAARVEREDPGFLKTESEKMRLKLEETHGRTRGERDVNIKFSAGGLLDIYFVVRFLQLTAGDRIRADVRSTSEKLEAFYAAGVFDLGIFDALYAGHAFLSTLDHSIRLVAGRSSRLPRASNALGLIAARMKLRTAEELNQQLAVHRIEIRSAFEKVFGSGD